MKKHQTPSSLFEEIEIIESELERKKYIEKISREKSYDPFYIATGTIQDRRSKIDKIWKIFKDHQDRDFLKQYKLNKNFSSRMWEMYIGAILLSSVCRFTTKDKSNLDFLVKDSFYIECVACQNACSKDKVDYVTPVMADGKVHDSPIREVLLRITNSITYKYGEYKKKLKENLVDPNKPFIIAINDSFRRVGKKNGYPNIYSLLFGLGDLQVSYPIGDVSVQNAGMISKGTKPIPIGYFNNSKYKELSAVIFSSENIINTGKKLGSDCFIIKNPFAINKLKANDLKFFSELPENYKVKVSIF